MTRRRLSLTPLDRALLDERYGAVVRCRNSLENQDVADALAAWQQLRILDDAVNPARKDVA